MTAADWIVPAAALVQLLLCVWLVRLSRRAGQYARQALAYAERAQAAAERVATLRRKGPGE